MKCCKCDKPMTELEAEESQMGNEFEDELLCDSCWFEGGCPPAAELEAMLLAAAEEQVERDAYYAARGTGCEWEAHNANYIPLA